LAVPVPSSLVLLRLYRRSSDLNLSSSDSSLSLLGPPRILGHPQTQVNGCRGERYEPHVSALRPGGGLRNRGNRRPPPGRRAETRDRKRTRLNSSHQINSYDAFC